MRLFLFIVFFVLFSSAYAQQQKHPAKLLAELQSPKSDSVEVELLHKLGQYYQREHYDSALYYLNRGLAIANKTGMTRQKARFLFTKSKVISYQGNYRQSIDTIKEAIEFYRKLNDSIGLADGFNSIGVNYYNLSEYDSCKMVWLKCKSIYKQTNDSTGMATTFSNLGVVNYVQGQAEEALKNFIKSLEIRKKIEDKHGLASNYMKIALIYDNKLDEPQKAYEYLINAVALYEDEQNELGKAKALTNLSLIYEQLDSLQAHRASIHKAREIAERIGNLRLLGTIYYNIGQDFQNKNNYDSTLVYYYKTLDIYKNLGQKRELTGVYFNMGEVFYNLSDYETARAYFKSSLDIAREINVISSQVPALQYLAKIFERKGDFKKAYAYHQKYAKAKDTLAEKEKTERLETLEARFEGEQKAQRIKILEKQKQLDKTKLARTSSTKNLILVIAGLIFIFSLLLYQKYRQKTSLNKQLSDRNQEVKEKNKEISKQAEHLKRFNHLLVEKNRLIEKNKVKLEEENQKKDKVFSIIGHDLRSPMSSLHTSLNLLKSKKVSPERKDHLISLMDSDINSAINLLENLLMWAKRLEGKLSTNFKKQLLNPVASQAIRSLEGMARNKNIEINADIDKEIKAYFDEQMIATVVRNLLSNAIKFSPERSQIKISMIEYSNFVKISVLDQGVGMDKSDIDKILHASNFHSTAGTQKEKGSGLGLQLCKDFVTQHCGSFSIESKPDRGTIVSFTLPTKHLS